MEARSGEHGLSVRKSDGQLLDGISSLVIKSRDVQRYLVTWRMWGQLGADSGLIASCCPHFK